MSNSMGQSARRCDAAAAVMMIRPVHFQSNAQTAPSNTFQRRRGVGADIAIKAAREFDALADALTRHGIEVHALAGDANAVLPDEVFPNNWISTHADGTIVLYPLLAENRRLERRPEIIGWLQTASGYCVTRTVDLTHFENSSAFLEGTGSLVLDHRNKLAFAAMSPRTHAFALRRFAQDMDFETIAFNTIARSGRPIYHTNVLMSLGSSFAVLCAEAIIDTAQRRAVRDSIVASGRRPIEISLEQLHEFSANILELRAPDGPLIAMSERARAALDHGRLRALERCGTLVSATISTIETFGGGSVRCMLAELRLPKLGE
jgi:hypothetical protein